VDAVSQGPALRVTVWNENVHERRDPPVAARYPDGIHGAVAEGIVECLGDLAVVRTATLDQPEHGLAEEVLDQTDVLVWWGHVAHDEVPSDLVDRLQERVLRGMGLVVLHSGHFSRIFRRLMGTSCSLGWRDDGGWEAVWCVNPGHPVAEGVPERFVLLAQETYSEFFDIPEPDELVFLSSFAGGELFRSGCGFYRGAGRVFYFSPGDQAYPVYHHPVVRRVIANAVRWAWRPEGLRPPEALQAPNRPAGWWREA